MKLNKKKVILLCIICVAIVLVAIYFIFQNKQQTSENTQQEMNYETEEMITNIRLGISEFDSIQPLVTQNREVIYLSQLIFEPLLTITKDSKIEPCLAKEWSKVGDKTYVIKLKENVVWQDGSSFTAADVEFTIQEIQQNKNSIYYENVNHIQSVTVVDNMTVRIELDQEIPFFEYNLIFPILSAKQYENENIQTSKAIPIGTGKYQISNITSEKIELTKNEKWRDLTNENFYIDKITVNLYETMGEAYNDFKLGNIDFLNTTNNDLEQYIGTMGYGKKEYAGREYDYLAINCEDSVLQYKEVRQAISYTIDQNKLVTTALENKAFASYFPLEENSYLVKDTLTATEVDTTKAREILEEAGWSYEYGIWQKEIDNTTKTINITLSVQNGNEQRVLVANAIKEQLEAVGIKVEVEKITDTQYQNYLKNHEYEMLLTGIYTSLSPDISSFFYTDNLANYSNEEILKILQELNNISQEELLQEKYKRIIEIYQEEVPYIGLYKSKNTVVYSTGLRGDVTPNNYNIYYHLSQWYRQ